MCEIVGDHPSYVAFSFVATQALVSNGAKWKMMGFGLARIPLNDECHNWVTY